MVSELCWPRPHTALQSHNFNYMSLAWWRHVRLVSGKGRVPQHPCLPWCQCPGCWELTLDCAEEPLEPWPEPSPAHTQDTLSSVKKRKCSCSKLSLRKFESSLDPVVMRAIIEQYYIHCKYLIKVSEHHEWERIVETIKIRHGLAGFLSFILQSRKISISSFI